MKVSTKIALCSLLFLISIASSCDNENSGHGDNRLTFINKSDTILMLLLQYNYPDTSRLYDEERSRAAYTTWSVDPKSEVKLWISTDWDKAIAERNPHNTLMIFVLSSDTVLAKPWSEIRQEYDILRRYDLTVDELKAQNWKVIYP